jgi:hypothetical protein
MVLFALATLIPYGRIAMKADQQAASEQIPIVVGGRVSDPEKYWTRTLRALFDRACTAGPVTTVGQIVEALAAQQWPGCRLWYNRQVISGYLKAHASQAEPLFFLSPVGMFIMLYLRACCGEPLDAADREAGPLRSVAGIARVAFLTNPEAAYWWGFVPPEVDPRKVWSLEKPGPVAVQPAEWPAFQEAFRGALGHGLVSLGAQSYRYGLNEKPSTPCRQR